MRHWSKELGLGLGLGLVLGLAYLMIESKKTCVKITNFRDILSFYSAKTCTNKIQHLADAALALVRSDTSRI